MVCDICGAQLSMERAYLVTTADVVLNEHYWRHAATGSSGGPGLSDEALREMVPTAAARRDPWAVCSGCVGMLDVDREVARSWALRGEAPPGVGPVDPDRAHWVAARTGRAADRPGQAWPGQPLWAPPPGPWNGGPPSGPMPSGPMPSGPMPSGSMPSGPMPSGPMPAAPWNAGPATAARGYGPVTSGWDDPTSVVGRRTGQYVLDVLVTFLVGLALFFLIGPLVNVRALARAIEVARTEAGDRTFVYVAIGAVALALAGFVVHVLWPRGRGQTPAMGWLGLRVVRGGDGAEPGFGRYLARWVLLAVDGLLAGLVGLLAMVASARHQRVGDMAAGTVVVRDPNPGRRAVSQARGAPVLIGMATFAVASLLAAGGVVFDHVLFYGVYTSYFSPPGAVVYAVLFLVGSLGQLVAAAWAVRERRVAWAAVFVAFALLWVGVAAQLYVGLALGRSLPAALVPLLLMVVVTLCRPRLPGAVTAVLVLADVALLLLWVGGVSTGAVYLYGAGVLFLAAGVLGAVVAVMAVRAVRGAAPAAVPPTAVGPPTGPGVWG